MWKKAKICFSYWNVNALLITNKRKKSCFIPLLWHLFVLSYISSDVSSDGKAFKLISIVEILLFVTHLVYSHFSQIKIYFHWIRVFPLQTLHNKKLKVLFCLRVWEQKSTECKLKNAFTLITGCLSRSRIDNTFPLILLFSAKLLYPFLYPFL